MVEFTVLAEAVSEIKVVTYVHVLFINIYCSIYC